MDKLYIRCSCALQAWLLKHPNAFTRWLLGLFYDADATTYTLIGAQTFLTRREALLGPNFVALGKLILGGYDDVARHILKPQKRGAYLGRFRLVEDRLSEYFLLFISDQGAGGGEVFEQVYETVWDLMLGPAVERTQEPEALAEIDKFVETAYALGNPPQEKAVAKDLQEMIIRYMIRVILKVELNDGQLEVLHPLAFGAKPSESFILSIARPFARDKVPSKVQAGEALFIDLVEKSPVMAGFDAANKYNLDRRQFVEALFQMIAVAGFLGSENLANSVLTKTPPECEIDVENAEAVEKAVLEVARRWSPVNNVNVIAQEPVTVAIKGKAHTFPVGTVMALSIGIANLDPKEFPKPKEFDPERANLCPHFLSFNAVGDEGARRCPGRGVAVAMASQLLVAWRKKVAAAAAS